LDRNPIGTVEFAKESATRPLKKSSIYPCTAEDGLDDEQYVVRLLGQVITVSLETLKLIGSLPELKF
jgi:predicted helicase